MFLAERAKPYYRTTDYVSVAADYVSVADASHLIVPYAYVTIAFWSKFTPVELLSFVALAGNPPLLINVQWVGSSTVELVVAH